MSSSISLFSDFFLSGATTANEVTIFELLELVEAPVNHLTCIRELPDCVSVILGFIMPSSRTFD